MDVNENIFAYKQRVNKALAKKRPFSTYNRDIMHATEIVAGGFKYAEYEVNLLSHELDKRIYGLPHIVKLAADFLSKRNGKLNIIIEQDVEADHPLISLREEYPNNIVVRKIPDEWWKKFYSYNFMTIDSFGYRFEPNRKELSAIVSFNEEEEKETLENLKQWFNFWSKHIDNKSLLAG